jgi:hypothetical protein
MSSTSRIGTLISERGNLQRTAKEAMAKISCLEEEKIAAVTKLESQSATLSKRWCEDVSELQSERMAAMARLEGDKATMRRQLQEALANVSQLQEQNTEMVRQAHEDKAALTKHFQEDIMTMREEKAGIVASLEEEKVEYHKRWQEDVAKLRESKEVDISGLEQEKGQLLRQLQSAMDEARRLQGEQVATEAKLAEERASMRAGLEAERNTSQRKWQEEFSRVLETQASEISKRESHQVQVHRQIGKEKERLEEEHHKVVVQLEAENTQLRKKWEAAVSESLVLQQEKAELAAALEGQAAEERERWQKNFLSTVSWVQKKGQGEAPRCDENQRTAETSTISMSGLSPQERSRVVTTVSFPVADDGLSSSPTISAHGSVASLQEARFFPEQEKGEKVEQNKIFVSEPFNLDLCISGLEVYQKDSQAIFGSEQDQAEANILSPSKDADGNILSPTKDESLSKWGSVWSPAWPQHVSALTGATFGHPASNENESTVFEAARHPAPDARTFEGSQ